MEKIAFELTSNEVRKSSRDLCTPAQDYEDGCAFIRKGQLLFPVLAGAEIQFQNRRKHNYIANINFQLLRQRMHSRACTSFLGGKSDLPHS